MTLPVSSYEELLARVRSLTSETIQLQQELTSTLFEPSVKNKIFKDNSPNLNILQRKTSANEKEISDFEEPSCLRDDFEKSVGLPSKDNASLQNDRTLDNLGLWHSGPSRVYSNQTSNTIDTQKDLASVISYTYCNGSEIQPFEIFSPSSRAYSHQQLGVKVEMVYNLLSMLDTNNREDMSKTFLAMSSSADSCHAMRQSGCVPLLVQLIHSPDLDLEVRNRAAEALQNIVDSQTDEKRRRREMRVLKLLQQIREYCHDLKASSTKGEPLVEDNVDKHPLTAMGALMKFSFDADHRQAICTLGGLFVITELIQVDHDAHGSSTDQLSCVTLRRYAGMSLTNLTFGDGKNKSLLCSFDKFMRALVDQLKSPSEDLRQVTASVLRNLSWRADAESKQALRDVGAVTGLTVTALEAKKESTLKSILSALWNLSAHCSMNKVDICSVPGALAFLVNMLKYKSASNTLGIVENAGGIIRNISSHIAVREDYRQILRDNNCFEVLLEHLKSPSLTIVSNACGTLWNLSARCAEDQKRLWEMGATSMLRSLIQSKHKMISMGSSAALKNLLTANPNGNLLTQVDSTAKSLGLQNLPTLFVRKQRALEQELNITLAETCDNIEPSESPVRVKSNAEAPKGTTLTHPKRSDSYESIKSTLSDSVYERINQIGAEKENNLLENKNTTLHQSLNDSQTFRKTEDQKFIKRYKASMIPTFVPKKVNQNKNKEKNEQDTLVEEGTQLLHPEVALKPKTEEGTSGKEQAKRGIPVLKTRRKFIKPPAKISLSNLSQEYCSELDFPETETAYEESEEVLKEPECTERSSVCHPGDNRESIQRESPIVLENLNENNAVENCPFENSSDLIQNGNSDVENNAFYNPGSAEEEKREEEEEGEKEEGEEKEVTFPDFKIGPQTIDSQALQRDANKICREIQKYQDMQADMGCSLASEISLVSCSSFLDAGDGSLFDCSGTAVDFDESENFNKGKNKNFHCKRSAFSHSGEPVSLPSLGSLKNEQIEAIDLESSIISIASITSEIAETSLRDKDLCETYTKTFRKDEPIKSFDETLADSAVLSNDEETLNGEEIRNDLDDENSLKSQENLPVDPDGSNNNVASSYPTKRLTPKDKRRHFQDRYRTYTIRDLRNQVVSNAIGQREGNVFSGSEGSNYEVKKTFPVSFQTNQEQNSTAVNRDRLYEAKVNFILNDEDEKKVLFRETATGDFASCHDSKYDLLKGSKSFDERFDQIHARTPESRSLDDLLSIGPVERKELVDNAKLVAFSLKTAVQCSDSDLSSDCESEENCRTLTIDTNTYNKDKEYKEHHCYEKFRNEEIEKADNERASPTYRFQTKGPIISKPQPEIQVKKLEDDSKAIRGRRKMLYSSGIRKFDRGNNSIPGSPKISHGSARGEKPNLTATKSLPNVSKKDCRSEESLVLHREGTFTKERRDEPPFRNTKAIPVFVRNSESKRLSSANSPARSKSATIIKNATAKNTKPPLTHLYKNNNKTNGLSAGKNKEIPLDGGNKIRGVNGRSGKVVASPGLSSADVRNSSVYQNPRGKIAAQLVSNPKSKNSSIFNSKAPGCDYVNTFSSVETEKEKLSKNEVTSKIVSLWKKVEETKKKAAKDSADTRVWINSGKPEKTHCIEQEEILDIPTRKIVHSHTYQGLTNKLPKTAAEPNFQTG